MLANLIMANQPPRYLFLVGVLPALLVLWIRHAVPEPEEWYAAKAAARDNTPGVAELFRGRGKRITLLVILVCATSLTAHWAFMFWHQQHLRNLPEVLTWNPQQKNALASKAMYMVITASIIGNFAAAFIARFIGFRKTIAVMCFGYFLAMTATYSAPRDPATLLRWLALPGFFQGLFALFTMYLPPLFPTLLRTTGAGFSYNIGRIVAAGGTVFFGLFSHVGDYRLTLLFAGLLFLPAGFIAWYLPELRRGDDAMHEPADYLSREVEYVFDAAFSLRGLTSGALLGSLLLVLCWKRAGALPVLIGALTSLAGMIFVSRFEWTATAAKGATVKLRVAWPWFTLTGTMVTLGTAWVTRALLKRKRSE